MTFKCIQFILLGLVVSICSCDYGRMWETPAVRPHEENLLVMPRGNVPYDGGEEIWMAMSADDLKSPVDPDDPLVVEQGKTLYFTFCAQCHGRNYDGKGTVGQSFSPVPADLRAVEVQSLSEGALFKEISYAVSGGRQPPLASTIHAIERWQIIAHVKSLGPRN